MAQLALLLLVVVLVGAGGAALVRHRRALDPAAVGRALAKAAAQARAGQREQARRRYARLVRRLAAAPEGLRAQRGLALLGQADATAALGDAPAALPLYREAFPLLPEPAWQLPRWSLRQLAGEAVRSAGGPAADDGLPPVLAFLQATAQGAEPGAEAEAAAEALDWLQRRCREGPDAQREHATTAALAALPGRDWPVLARTALLHGAGRPQEAEALLAAAAPGGGGELWFRRGAQLSARQQDAAAVAAFEEALRRGPGEPSPWSRGPLLRAESLLFRGLAQQQLGALEAAEADLRAAVAEAPRDPRPRYALGRLALLRGEDEQAREQFTAALGTQHTYAPARLGLALLHERASRPADAAADYQAALALSPHWRPARVRLGAALLAAGRGAEAEPLLRAEAADRAPGDTGDAGDMGDGAGAGADGWRRTAAFHHGLALSRAGDPAGALARWEPLRGVDLLDRLALARDQLARRQLAADPAAARALWQQAVTDAPAAPGYRSALREAALREAAQLLIGRRDLTQAAAALAVAAPPPPGTAGPSVAGTPHPAPVPATAARRTADRRTADRRTARLRAALALAQGAADGVAALLSPVDGPRERYHLAAAALVTGRPVQTVALLAPLEPAPTGDPGTARLRALLAERAGNWPAALEWHQRFLDSPAGHSPATGPAPGVVPSSAAPHSPCGAAVDTSCARTATGACGSCGREGCADHLYRPEQAGAGSPRCAGCVGPALRALLDCARRAGLVEQAESALSAWAAVLGEGSADPVRRDLALLRAERGDLAGALATLPAGAARERGAVLVRSAAAALAAGQSARAAGELRQVVDLMPEHPQAGAALALLAEHETHLHAVEGRYQQAWEGYRALLLKDPTHPRLQHALGLIGYRLATAGAGGGGTGSDAGPDGTAVEQDESLWQWTIGSLTAALHQPELWHEAARSTGRAAEAERTAAARAALIDRLREDLRLLDRAHGRSGDEVAAWTVRLGMEAHSAEAFAQEEELRISAPSGDSRRLILGPTLAGLLEGASTGPELLDWQRGFARAVQPWRRPGPFGVHPVTQALGLFGALGPHRYLLLQGRHAAAVAALDAIPGPERDEAWRELLREALTSQATEHHRQQDWREALACLTRARQLDDAPTPPALAEIAADCGLRAARALLKETGDDQAGAVALLEQARALAPEHAEVRSNLGAAYAQLARKISNEDKEFTRALALLRQAIELAPQDPTARHFLAAALGNRARELSAPGPEQSLVTAVGLWQELIALEPQEKEHRLGLAHVLGLLARTAALAEDRVQAVGRMTAALQADPDWNGNTAREAPRRLAVLLANTLEEYRDRPFRERSALLQLARSYDDSVELRGLMLAVWRSEAADHFGAKRFQDATTLLEEALKLAPNPVAAGKVREELGIVCGAHAVRQANMRQLRQARSLIAQAVQYDPKDRNLRNLQRRINSLR
ncbi:hypothetical protein [Kitasatospora sp. NBC_01302]|uniref:hypothetical protein n=1 Tax=Kitasatospora sp. NBC_01302 TaxID=2903575 RepID=UPI002E124FE7|nr:hypothetical protein OG294_32425 [Kitasatospora sp. NBC_01302]